MRVDNRLCVLPLLAKAVGWPRHMLDLLRRLLHYCVVASGLDGVDSVELIPKSVYYDYSREAPFFASSLAPVWRPTVKAPFDKRRSCHSARC